MERIKSFTIDHNSHPKGFYLSNEMNGIFTYDLRFKVPNEGDYLSNAAIHTIEHLFATVIRNSKVKEKVVYFGPMGCRTGFYLLLNNINKEEAKSIMIICFNKCLELDTIPGASKEECGNYLEHSLDGAKAEIKEYLKVLIQDKKG